MRTWGTVVAATLVAAGPVVAFYFPGWPADGLRPPVTLYSPAVKPPEVTPQSDREPLRYSSPASRPNTVPEPSTLMLVAAGLAALASGRREPVRSRG